MENETQFIVNRLRKEPIQYMVTITHYVANGEWMQSTKFDGVSIDTDREKESVAFDLNYAAQGLIGEPQPAVQLSEDEQIDIIAHALADGMGWTDYDDVMATKIYLALQQAIKSRGGA